MDEKEIILRIKRCLKKAHIRSWYASEDEDDDSDLFFSGGNFFIKNIKTEFTAGDFLRITKRNFKDYEDNDSVYDDYVSEHNYVKLLLRAGNHKTQVIWIHHDLELSAQLKDGHFYNQGCDVLNKLRVNAYKVDTDLSTESMTIREGALTEYTGSEETLKIPEGTIEISSNVFKGNKAVKQICLPQSLEQIHPYAFTGCTNLSQITFAETANLFIGPFAFSCCENLSKIDLPETVTASPKAFLNSGMKAEGQSKGGI